MARPSKLGVSTRGLVVQFRVPDDDAEALKREAALQGVTVNELARQRTLGRSLSPEVPSTEPRELVIDRNI
jgi:hypothetical protein